MPLAQYTRETLLDGKSLGEYYVIFSESELDLPLLNRAFSHVWAAKWDGFNWVAINMTPGHADIFVMDCCEPDIRLALVDVEYTDIIQVTAWRKPKKWRTLWPVAFTCVEQVKALLGISTWWIFTPRQLYKYLGGKL